MFQVGNQCGHCGYSHCGPCPRIKAIEYHPDGTIKRIEYVDAPRSYEPSSPIIEEGT